MTRDDDRSGGRGLLDRLRRRFRDEPSAPAPGLFTARSGTAPTATPPPTLEPDERLFPAPADRWSEEPSPAEASAPQPAPQPAPEPAPAAEPAPPPGPVTLDPAPAPDRAVPAREPDGRTVRVHDGRLDNRPGPIRMTPSEAVTLAQDGPGALRRRTHPGA